MSKPSKEFNNRNRKIDTNLFWLFTYILMFYKHLFE